MKAKVDECASLSTAIGMHTPTLTAHAQALLVVSFCFGVDLPASGEMKQLMPAISRFNKSIEPVREC